VVASVGVPSLSNLLHIPVVVVGAASGAAALSAVAVAVASVEADVVLAVGEEEGSETEVDLATEAVSETGVAVVSEAAGAAASEEAGMTLDHREVEVAIGSCSAEWCGTSY
jgi:acetyl-CoA acetyltransferase